MKPPFEMIQETEIEKWRYETFYTKEPETIEWIKSFDPGGHFLDIGANIGIYSLYCVAIHQDITVTAIEPFKTNADRLRNNIKYNKFNRIHVVNVAVGSENGYSCIKISEDISGSSGHQLSHDGEDCIVITLDLLNTISRKITDIPINYIKIDTDGNEFEIIKNGLLTIAFKDLRSVLIEVNDHKEEIIEIFKQNGFTTDNRFNTMTPHSRERRQREGINAENIIFTR